MPVTLQPPITVEDFNTNNMEPAIMVEGDVMLKEYQFIVEESKEKLLKIGRAVHDLSELGQDEVGISDELDINIC